MKLKWTLLKAATEFGVSRESIRKGLVHNGIAEKRYYTTKEIFGAVGGDLRQARTRVSTATAEKIESENSKRRGEVVNREQITGGIQTAMAILFSELDRLFTSELPASAKGLDEAGIAAKAKQKISELKVVLREKFAAIGNQ